MEFQSYWFWFWSCDMEKAYNENLEVIFGNLVNFGQGLGEVRVDHDRS